MNIIEHKSDALGERYYETVLDNGLRVYICPKPDFATAYAVYGTRYGSIDTRFRLGGDGDFADVPEGIAHFLEHKLFESEDLDAFERFAKTGAYANAYTSFDRTCYLFACTSNFEANLDILLDFVQSPYFTAASVQKEQGIIGQEIRMYDDDPQWRVMFNLLCAMYQNHPVRIDIAGTVESIAEIDDKLLYKCYETFYDPSNMFICIAGDVDAEAVIGRIADAVGPSKGLKIERSAHSEPVGIVSSYTEQKLSVSQPMFCMGFKEPCDKPEVTLREYLQTNILLDIIAGESSPLFGRLLDEGLIGENLGTEFFNGYGYAAELFEGESRDPSAVRDALLGEIERLRRDGIDAQDFIRSKNSLYGQTVMQYNNVEQIGGALVAAAMGGYDLFSMADEIAAVTLEDIERRLHTSMSADTFAMSVVAPK